MYLPVVKVLFKVVKSFFRFDTGDDIFPEEKEDKDNRSADRNSFGDAAENKIKRHKHAVKGGKILSLDRNYPEEEELFVRCEDSVRDKHGEIEVVSVHITDDKAACDKESCACEEVPCKLNAPPVAFKARTDDVVEVKVNKHKQGAVGLWHKEEGRNPPDLSPQYLGTVKTDIFGYPNIGEDKRRSENDKDGDGHIDHKTLDSEIAEEAFNFVPWLHSNILSSALKVLLVEQIAVVDSGNESGYRGADNIGMDTCAPEYALVGLYTHIAYGFGVRAYLHSVFLVGDKGIVYIKTVFNGIGNSVKSAVAHSFSYDRAAL